jgi:putative glycosyltransferase (TIGR04348 family)
MPSKNPQRISIITPALAEANNGNWQTAKRWSFFLDKSYKIEVSKTLDTNLVLFDALIGLHARRSAAAIREFAHTGKPIAVVLTGTDLYGDTTDHIEVRESLEIAHRIVVLQEDALKLVPEKFKPKTEVIYQSASVRKPGPFRQRTFDIAFIGHLRAVKDPVTVLKAMTLLAEPQIRLIHVGNLDDYSREFAQAMADDARIESKGPLPHGATRQVLGKCRLMVISSIMEGGANVVIEALTNAVPVLASRISGNIGMLGKDYPGFFDVGDYHGLASLVTRCMEDKDFLDRLRRHGDLRSSRFYPDTEKRAVLQLAGNLLNYK